MDFKMRKGMKWSDASRSTARTCASGGKIIKPIPTSTLPWWQFGFGGENMKVDILDEFTFRFTHAVPSATSPLSAPAGPAMTDSLWPSALPEAVPRQIH
jgi:hypothetical protein